MEPRYSFSEPSVHWHPAGNLTAYALRSVTAALNAKERLCGPFKSAGLVISLTVFECSFVYPPERGWNITDQSTNGSGGTQNARISFH